MSELLEFGRAVLAQQPFSVHLGAQLVRFEPGIAELSVPLGEDLRQQNGFAHGGAIGYVVDNAITFAGGSVLGPHVLTQEYKISYLRPALGDRLVGRAQVVHNSPRQAVVRCDVYAVDAEGEKLCATALGTTLRIDR